MRTYSFYVSGILRNKKYTIQAKNKQEAIEKACKHFQGAVTIRTFRRVK